MSADEAKRILLVNDETSVLTLLQVVCRPIDLDCTRSTTQRILETRSEPGYLS